MDDREAARQALSTFLDGMLRKAQHIDSLPLEDTTRRQAEAIGQCVTAIVGHLANEFPNARVRKLMSWVWHLIGSHTTPTAMSPMVKTPTVVVVGGRSLEDQRVSVLIPPEWPDNITQDPIMAMGAMVYCGSQLVDYFNDKVAEGPKGMKRRAQLYEAEFLRTCQQLFPSWTPNDYQQTVLAAPEPEVSLFYESREVPLSTRIEG